MNLLSIHTLIVPSFEHIHRKHIGHVLGFLMEAQECGVEVICLDPAPTRLNAFTLAVIPLTREQQVSGIVTLEEGEEDE